MGAGLKVLQYGPGTAGITVSMDMTAAATTQYETNAIVVEGLEYVQITTQLNIVGAATAGNFKIYAIPCQKDGTEVGPNVDLCIALGSTVDAQQTVLGISRAIAKSDGGTVDADGPVIMGSPKLKFGIEVTTVGNAASTAALDMYLNITRRRRGS